MGNQDSNVAEEGKPKLWEERLKTYGVPVLLCFGGIFLLVISYTKFMPDIQILRIILQTLAGVAIGAGLIEASLMVRFQRRLNIQINTLRKNVSVLKDSVSTLGTSMSTLDESVSKSGNNVLSLEKNIDTLQKTLYIAKGAIESGLAAVYSQRFECLVEIKGMLEEILKEKPEKYEIMMLGISLGDFLCPHGLLQPTFNKVLEQKNIHLSIIILEDGSLAALHRAISEEREKFRAVPEIENLINDAKYDITKILNDPRLKEIYETTKCHNELKTATDYLRYLVKDSNIYRQINAYKYNCSPMVFLFMMEKDMFIENYHLAGRGGEAPILRVSRYKPQAYGSGEESKLYRKFAEHFVAVQNMSVEMKPSDTNNENEQNGQYTSDPALEKK